MIKITMPCSKISVVGIFFVCMLVTAACSQVSSGSKYESPQTINTKLATHIRKKIAECERLNLSNSAALHDNFICFSGALEKGDDQLVKNLLQANADVNAIVIKSNGGFGDDSIRVAQVVFEHGLDVIVWDYCTSGCSNYVFMAGKKKYLLDGALLGFHAAPLKNLEELYNGLRTDEIYAKWSDEQVRTLAVKRWGNENTEYHLQEHFLKTLNLNNKILYEYRKMDLVGLIIANNLDKGTEVSPDTEPESIEIGWFPSPTKMYEKYGVPNILCEVCDFSNNYTIEHSINRGFLLFESLSPDNKQ